ncbi:hypothetical protein B0H12DRAFT_1116130 [Mycena haematopus]|nr:hypothetical protein B0H12DRAFT_1116130 [Mycena haematopus]
MCRFVFFLFFFILFSRQHVGPDSHLVSLQVRLRLPCFLFSGFCPALCSRSAFLWVFIFSFHLASNRQSSDVFSRVSLEHLRFTDRVSPASIPWPVSTRSFSAGIELTVSGRPFACKPRAASCKPSSRLPLGVAHLRASYNV